MHDPAPGAEMLARRLIVHEANSGQAPEQLVAAAERVLQRLREDLARVLGGDGFSALEQRALDMAGRRFSCLRTGGTDGNGMHVRDDVRAALAGRDPLEAGAALRAMCAHLIGLLFTFLGEPLTTHFIRLAWPELPADDPAARERERR